MSDLMCKANFHGDDPVGYDRLVFDPSGRPFAAIAMCQTWRSPAGRMVWFTLESQLPHVSSIAACFGIPNRPGPILTMNLNHKPQFFSLGCIAGFRAKQGDPIAKACQNLPPPPAATIAQPAAPPDFVGTRAVFPASREMLDWALAAWSGLASAWAARCAQPDLDYADNLGFLDSYRQSIEGLHRQGGVFDAIFGEGWVSQTFGQAVFATSNG